MHRPTPWVKGGNKVDCYVNVSVGQGKHNTYLHSIEHWVKFSPFVGFSPFLLPESYATSVVDNDKDPWWDEWFHFDSCFNGSETLVITLRDEGNEDVRYRIAALSFTPSLRLLLRP